MRLAAFSDIHANEQAISACLAFADHLGADAYAFLGDHLTDCPYPRRTLDILRAAADRRPTYFLRGNREDYLIRHRDNPADGWKPGSNTGSWLYTYQNLDSSDIEWLRAMPVSRVLDLPGCPKLIIAHAAPANNNVLLFPGSEALDEAMRRADAQTVVAGHSHIQFRYESAGRQFVNPGAVGLPSHGQTKAQFAMLTCLGGRWNARLMNVDYDLAAELRQFDESGLREMGGVWTRAIIHTLKKGGSCATDCLQLARKLAGGEKEIPEVCWEEAAVRLGIS